MTISKRQFTWLTAMGIPLWSERLSSAEKTLTADSETSRQVSSNVSPATKIETITPVNNSITHSSDRPEQKNAIVALENLSENRLFQDIILAIGLSLTDIKVNQQTLELGSLHWQFADNNKISFVNNLLITPNLTLLANSVSLKRQLWQLISRQELL